jgi:hypothetical protein
VRPVPHREELVAVLKPQENLTCSDDSSKSDKDYQQQEGDNVDCYLTFEASCSSSLMQDVNEFSCDWNLA